MSPRHVRAVAAASAAIVLVLAITALSILRDSQAAAGRWSGGADRSPQPVAGDPLGIRKALPLSPATDGTPPHDIEADGFPSLSAWRAAVAAGAGASPPPDPAIADLAPATVRSPVLVQAEQAPFALSLLVGDAKGGVSLAVSPLPYPDRPACDLAGQQWALEVRLSGIALASPTFICIPQVADIRAMLARRRADIPGQPQ